MAGRRGSFCVVANVWLLVVPQTRERTHHQQPLGVIKIKMVHRVNLVSNLILLACIIASPVFAFSLTQRKSLDVVVRGSHSQLVRRSDTAVYGSIIKQRLTFNSPPGQYGKEIPKLILISGCPGTGEREHVFFLSVIPVIHKRTTYSMRICKINCTQASQRLACHWRWSKAY